MNLLMIYINIFPKIQRKIINSVSQKSPQVVKHVVKPVFEAILGKKIADVFGTVITPKYPKMPVG